MSLDALEALFEERRGKKYLLISKRRTAARTLGKGCTLKGWRWFKMALKPSFTFKQSVNIESNRTIVTDLLCLIERPGIDNLLDYLLETDYFTAPASTRFHNVCEGGLCQHSLNVTREFSKENVKWQKPVPQESVLLCGILHDACKIGAYAETSIGYVKNKEFPKGHGKLSVSRIEEHIKLTQPEKNIILFHMELFGIYIYHEYSAWAIYKAIVGTPQVQAFASIDMADSKRKVDATQSRTT